MSTIEINWRVSLGIISQHPIIFYLCIEYNGGL
jgi:hypothetical protein